MTIQGINSVRTQANCCEQKQIDKTQQAQIEFLSQINEGKSEKEAFIKSLEVLSEKQNIPTDTLCLKASAQAPKIGSMPSMSPADALKWLEVIAVIGTMGKGAVDWFLDTFIKPNEKPQGLDIAA
ncbi:MAG: hypothetical protein E7Z90_02895 [Cyanobacteria bacterium SIG29]|nr:hypothetical protein [Cyanobacteria bacterium SIG29]